VKIAPCTVYIDPKRTQQVLFNVIDNAIKHSECTLLHIELTQHKRYGLVRIVDNGKGISDQDQQMLFLPAEKKQGRIISEESHGLGLPICKQFMELQWGSISIISEVGEGTEVRLEFPIDPPNGQI
jgi:signal transduction histidine kinase